MSSRASFAGASPFFNRFLSLAILSFARTNTPYGKTLYCKTIGKIFADIRNLGYTDQNVLIAGKHKYHNQPRIVRNGKSLEPIWHRSTLDLLAAIALIPDGRFVGEITSYKAGHRLDCDLITQLYLKDLLMSVGNG